MSFKDKDEVTRCFNSRSREGSDLASGQINRLPSCFNSRSREGSDTLILRLPI